MKTGKEKRIISRCIWIISIIIFLTIIYIMTGIEGLKTTGIVIVILIILLIKIFFKS